MCRSRTSHAAGRMSARTREPCEVRRAPTEVLCEETGIRMGKLPILCFRSLHLIYRLLRPGKY